jgi:hypothetical protein
MHIDSQDVSLRSLIVASGHALKNALDHPQYRATGHAKPPSQTGPLRHMRPWHAWLLTGIP